MPAVADRQYAESLNCDGDNSTEIDVITVVSCNDSSDCINADCMIENNVNDRSDVARLIRAQQSDESLAECHRLAKLGKGNYEYRQGVLFHFEKV